MDDDIETRNILNKKKTKTKKKSQSYEQQQKTQHTTAINHASHIYYKTFTIIIDGQQKKFDLQ